MNLKQFLEYRTRCPCCLNELIEAFCSRSRILSFDNNIASVIIKLKSLKRGQKSYYAKLTIYNDGSFSVDFEGEEEKFDNKVPLFVLDRFKEFIANSSCTMIRYCKCNEYVYYSKIFNFDLRSKTFNVVTLDKETFSSVRLNNHTVCNVSSSPTSNITILNLYKYPMEENKITGPFEKVTLPFIDFSSKSKMIERINKLLVFS